MKTYRPTSLALAGLMALALLGPTAMSALAGMDDPRVMLLIDEKNLGTIPTAEVEALAARLLLQEGLNVVDQEMVRANIKKDQQLLKMAGDARGAAAVGLQFGAEIVIVGDAVAKPSAGRIADSNLRTYQAVVTLRALKTDTATTLASVSETASTIGLEDVSGSSKVLKLAGTKTLSELIPTMMDAWNEAHGISGGSREVEIAFGGIDAVWMLKGIRQSLGKNDSITDIVQRNYTPGAATFEVKSAVPAPDLAESLVLNPPRKLRLQVLNVTARKINMRAVRE